MQDLPGGAMLSIRMPAAEIDSKLDGNLSVAAINAPSLCVVSGPTEAVAIFQHKLEKDSVMCRSLHTSHAFHSAMMDPIIEPFAEKVKRLQLSPPKTPYVSTLTGTWITAEQATDPMHWAKQLRTTVRFADGVQQLWQKPERVLLEVGPRMTCSTLARQQAKDIKNQVAISSLGDSAGDQAEWTAMLTAMGQLWLAGVQIDWESFYEGEIRHRVALPTYPFERKRFWIEPAGVGALGNVKEEPAHPSGLKHSIQQDVQQFTPGPSSKDEHDTPNTEAEILLASLWRKILGVERIGVDDNFFDLGGDSLAVVQVIEIIKKKTNVHLDPKIFLLALKQIAPYLQVKPSLTETKAPAVQVESNYYVTEVSSKEDLTSAISIWESNLGGGPGSGLRKYQWFYQRNPYPTKLWVMKLKGNHKAVGVGGVGYRPFYAGGKTLIGAMGVDFAIDREYRTLGPALQLQRTVIESATKDADFLYGFPSDRAEVLVKHAGYHKIGEFTRLIKVLRSRDYLEMAVKNRALAAVTSIPLDLLLRLRSISRLLVSGDYYSSDTFENTSHIYDLLWERLASEDLLMSERNSKFMDWRYFQCPEIKYKIFGLKDHANSLQAFIIYHRRDRKVEIADLVCPQDGKDRVIQSLLWNFEKYSFSAGANLIGINLIGAAGLTQLLRSMGYWHNKKQKQPLYIYTKKNAILLDLFKDLDHSYWLGGDWQ